MMKELPPAGTCRAAWLTPSPPQSMLLEFGTNLASAARRVMLLPALMIGVLIGSFSLAFALEWGLLTLIVRVMGQAADQNAPFH